MRELFHDSAAEPFNSNWLFQPPGAAATPEGATPVTLPHAWNGEGWSYGEKSNTAPSGTGWYFKTLAADIPDNALIKFEGVSAECEVFLNGKSLRRNLGAHKAFEARLEGLRHDGKDLLAVKVVDKASVTLLPEGSDPVFAVSPRFVRWPLPKGSSLTAGGVWRDVWLFRSEAMSPPALRCSGDKMIVTPDFGGKNVKCELSKDGVVVACGEASTGSLTLTVANPERWWPLKPVLYQLETAWLDAAGKVVQTIRQPAAFFDFRIRDSEFQVNGKPYFLRGQNGFPHCNVPHDREYIAKYVAAVRAQGVEISRFHTEPPSHAWLDECDRQGIMVIFEMALHGSYGCYAYGDETFQKTVLEEFQSLFLEYRRHPSIALWCLGNEMIVSCERDRGLGAPLFDVLEKWIDALRPLDSRPIIADSCRDAANLIHKSVGDVDDMHQYGGWYVENLRDLRNFGRFTRKNDMLFQPAISTESIAAYTNDAGECFVKHGDVRQRKIVAMRLGKVTDLAAQSQNYQAFMLKEYSEALWRLRHADSSFAGYIPFGQYTWFVKPFDKGPDGVKPKMIWDTYRQVLGPVHVQLECWNRNIEAGGCLEGTLRLFHEAVALPEDAKFLVRASLGSETLFEREFAVAYHRRADLDVKLGPFVGAGPRMLSLTVHCGGKVVADNHLNFKVCAACPKVTVRKVLAVYDPAGRLDAALDKIGAGGAERLGHVEEILAKAPADTVLLIGPHALDADTAFHAEALKGWLAAGGRAIVLEQTPNPYTEDVLKSGIGFIKATQPYWSRWATNLVKHADRADMVQPEHPVFAGLVEDDLRWWNGDTFLAHAYLSVKTVAQGDQVLSRIGNGLADDELMPVAYDYVEPGYSLIMMERQVGRGSLLISSLLLGEKAASDPYARALFANLLK